MFLTRPWRMQVRVRFAAPRRALRLAAEAPWAPDAARPRAYAWRIDQQTGESPADFARRVAAVVAPFALDPADRPPAGEPPDVFPEEPSPPPRSTLLGPGTLPVYVAVPALRADDRVRRAVDGAPPEAAPDPDARWQVLNRLRWARLGGEGSRASADALAARLNVLGRPW